MKYYEKFERIGTEPHRSYYIPFNIDDKVGTVHQIIDRTTSSRFRSLDGTWQIKQHSCVEDFDIGEEIFEEIPVPSSVQMHGYDHIQYLNTRYPFPVLLPHIPHENPCWHYRRVFDIKKNDTEKYYLNFEGVDSAFYLYINGHFIGYSQISHSALPREAEPAFLLVNPLGFSVSYRVFGTCDSVFALTVLEKLIV